jgi:hypothetical protein
MSRSKKKPIIQLTHQIDKDIDHRRVRRRVKVELAKFEEPDIIIIEGDTRDFGLEELGTVLGYHTADICNNDDERAIESKKVDSRK